jgi:hypothetical protein
MFTVSNGKALVIDDHGFSHFAGVCNTSQYANIYENIMFIMVEMCRFLIVIFSASGVILSSLFSHNKRRYGKRADFGIHV